ncbi:hypothetical protein C2E23DRAFT_57464 [Lenzites betulinus]|nr:hypothetical protein C2E23DRAFT_57464 [Lenzites betulinus]
MPLQLGRYSVHIRCDDKELEMFDVKLENEKTISCWIPSEEGKAFSVHWKDESSAAIMMVWCYMDGRKVAAGAHKTTRTGKCSGVYKTAEQIAPFVFAPLVLTDDEAFANNNIISAELGTIRVEMIRVQNFTSTQTPFYTRDVHEIGPIHERNKKAGVHTVALGPPKKAVVSYGHVPVGADDEPFAIFKFCYRPLALLQANGIAPPSAPPAKNKKRAADVNADPDANGVGPSDPKRPRTDTDTNTSAHVKPEPDDDDEDDGVDDMQFLEEQLAMMQRRVEQARAERQAKKNIKREVSPIHVPLASSQEVIDLT